MHLDELLQTIWAAETNQYMSMDADTTSSLSSLQRQASLTLARALSGKTIDEMWKEILQRQKERYGEVMKSQDREPTLGETTLEDFLVQAGLYAETSLSPALGLDSFDVENPQKYSQRVSLSSSSSIDSLSETTTMPRQKRYALDTFKAANAIERRLKRKIKNRESAALSRAKKQAYHDELVSKVSRLEQENIKLKKEKDFEKMYPCEPSPEPKYQLRRTTSF